MRKNFFRFLQTVGLIVILYCDTCYADMVDPMTRFKEDVKEVLLGNIAQIIIIGVIIVAIVVGAIKVLIKSKSQKKIESYDTINDEEARGTIEENK